MTTEWEDITDPEELFRLKREGWEIEVKYSILEEWLPWDGKGWTIHWRFYARPRQPKVVTKKLCAWMFKHNGSMDFRLEGITLPSDWIRQPHLDLEARFPE